MNYSTLKKTVVLSCVSLMAVGLASAQTDTTKKTTDAATTAKLFGGAGQYNTWSIGVNVGATGSSVLTGGANTFNQSKVGIGFGVSVKDQLSHAFGVQLDVHGGQIKGQQNQSPDAKDNAQIFVTDLNTGTDYKGFKTNFLSGSLSGVVNFGNISFLHRANAINFYASAGFGYIIYDPSVSTDLSNYTKWSDVNGDGHKVKQVFIPVGVGVKFRASDHLDFNVGYTENFVDGYNLTGVHSNKYPATDKFSYGYVGLEYTLGSSSKQSLEWVNPIAMMYDELYDAALRQEVEALKGRVTNVETAVNDLKKDSDGDGVADQFDKCPNTPAGSIVDGSGCPIVFPKPDTTKAAPTAVAYSNIQFEFDSSVLKTSSYPVLDATSADMRTNSSTLTLAGYASSEGTAAHNLRLSKDRANSVKTYLVNSGVDAKRVKVKGFGETHPIADNSTEEGRVANRRVEFHK